MIDEEKNIVDLNLLKEKSKGSKPIEFGSEFHNRTDMEKIQYLHKLASSLNSAAVTIQKEREECQGALFQMETQLEHCQKKRLQDQRMIHQQLLAENKKYQELLEENQELQAEIKRLEDGHKRQLGE